jgi:hypothetical protein
VAIALALALQTPSTATGQGGPMNAEREAAVDAFLYAAAEKSELANVWIAIFTMCLMIACTVTIGVWLLRYHEEAESIRLYAVEPTSAIQLILDDCNL